MGAMNIIYGEFMSGELGTGVHSCIVCGRPKKNGILLYCEPCWNEIAARLDRDLLLNVRQ